MLLHTSTGVSIYCKDKLGNIDELLEYSKMKNVFLGFTLSEISKLMSKLDVQPLYNMDTDRVGDVISFRYQGLRKMVRIPLHNLRGSESFR